MVDKANSQLKLHRVVPKQHSTSAYLSFNDSIQTPAPRRLTVKLAKNDGFPAHFRVWASNKAVAPPTSKKGKKNSSETKNHPKR